MDASRGRSVDPQNETVRIGSSQDVGIGQLQRDIEMVGEKCRRIETLLLSKDTDITGSLEDLFTTFRTVSHNQTVLENKLDDALRNQMNTDLMVNSINERLNKLSENFNEIDKLQLNTLTVSQNTNSEISRPTSSVKRGPGRPRKSGSAGLASRSNDANNRSNLTPSKILLPTGNVQIPKSKRYFSDPTIKSEPAKMKEQNSQLRARVVEKAVEPNESPVKRRRGRPPKRRVVETVITPNAKDEEILTKKEESEGEQVENSKLHREDDEEDDGGNGDNEEESVDDVNDQDYCATDRENTPRVISASYSNGTSHQGFSPTSTRSSVAPNSELVPSTGATADTTILRDAEDQRQQQPLGLEDTEAGHETPQVIIPASKKRLLGASSNERELDQNEDIEKQDFNSTPDISADSAANRLQRELQQRELDKRRDSREKMLVSMKYNDRQKTKSFMESNKKLLQAMREEERKKRMTALIYDSGPNGTQQILSGAVPNSKVQEHIFKLEEKIPAQSKKMGISTMLNGEAFTTSLSSPPSPEDHKRRRSFDYFSDEPHTLRQLRRRKIADSLSAPAIGTVDPPIEENNESNELGAIATTVTANSNIDDDRHHENTPDSTVGHVNNASKGNKDSNVKGNKNNTVPITAVSFNGGSTGGDSGNAGMNNIKKSDSQTSLLLTSPIELLCKDGFFFRRNTPENPISVGTYLEFKFKPKEEELINLTINQRDFVDKTKQERMNAHFLKPEIHAETEFTFQILKKTTLTEKYVNSLEYFVMEFRWENKLVGLGLKLRESKRTWQRRKALFSLFEFWRDQSREKRGFVDYTMMHAVKEMENYRIFINRSVSWFYNHITLLKMILYDLCDNVDSQWREWMFARDSKLPIVGQDGVTENNINEAIDNVLTLDFLDDGTENSQIKSHSTLPMSEKSTDDEAEVDDLDDDDIQEQEQAQVQQSDVGLTEVDN